MAAMPSAEKLILMEQLRDRAIANRGSASPASANSRDSRSNAGVGGVFDITGQNEGSASEGTGVVMLGANASLVDFLSDQSTNVSAGSAKSFPAAGNCAHIAGRAAKGGL